jgi:hypothetical protein
MLAEAVEEADPAKLLKLVDGLCKDRDWEILIDLRALCEHAVGRGKQLWAIADHIEYRLALEAPAEWAGPMVVEGAGRFTIGPLPEVAASRHTWKELNLHLPEGPARTVTAYERVVRGEDLRDAVNLDPLAMELPLHLQEWEPRYPLATYHSDKAEFPPPHLPKMEEVELEEPPPPETDDLDSIDALLALTKPWTTESNGRSEAVAVHGGATSALRRLGPSHVRRHPISAQLGMAFMAWAGASGGAYGRRPGAAAGRYAAWWAAAAMTDLLADWPVEPNDLGVAIEELNWFVWSDLVPPTGWSLHLAVEDPDHDIAWAVAAVDAR